MRREPIARNARLLLLQEAEEPDPEVLVMRPSAGNTSWPESPAYVPVPPTTFQVPVAGNVANPRAQVITAAGEGSAAAIAINADLVREEVRVRCPD